MAEPWLVLKFGGTSVAAAPQWEAIARLAEDRRAQGHRVLLVCSALAGVTDALESLASEPAGAGRALDALLDRHAALAAALGIASDTILERGRSRLENALQACRDRPGPPSRARLLANGEWLSTRLGQAFLARRLEVDWVDARDALEASPEPDPDGARAWLSARCAAGADATLQAAWRKRAPVLIAQGFVLRAPCGGTALLGRGGSDTSAALLASRLGAVQAEIWTDVPGLFSADPRLEPAARPIPELSYAEALEMAAGGARVIHGRSIRAAAAAGLALVIRDLARPDLPGTRIGASHGEGPSGIRAITVQAGMAVLLLENLDTRQQVGFLAGVFQAIARRGVSVDQVATSETTTTLAIDCRANHLDAEALGALAEDLTALCQVTLFEDCSCVNLVGRRAHTALANLGPLRDHLDANPVLMVSQSANDMCLSLLVPAAQARVLQRQLHRALVRAAP